MRFRTLTFLTAMAFGGLLLPLPARAVATAVLPSDFNGDGYADLAVGVPGEMIGTKSAAGGINVINGSASGLTAAADQFWSLDSPGVKGVAVGSGRNKGGTAFGEAVASGDFDRDGYADLAASSSLGITVLYGSPTGLTADRDQLLTSAALALPTDILGIGGTLAAADFDGDGYGDLATSASVTATDEDEVDSGRVVVLRGGAGGLTAIGAVVLDRSMTGTTNFIEPAHWFGSALAVGDIDGDGFADLAVGLYVDDDHDARADVGVFYGSTDGLTADGNQSWTQAALGYEGHYLDKFGLALAIGDFDADGFGDLAIGTPESDLVPVNPEEYGEVVIVRGSATGLTAAGSQLWDEDVPGIPSAGHGGEQFGYALAAGDLDGDGADDLAIGVPGEGSGASGGVITLYGGIAGLSASGSQLWTQDSAGVPGSRERGDWFGASLACANLGRSGADDLIVGVPGEDHAGRSGAGVVNVLYGRAAGLSGSDAQAWSQATTGIKETPESDDGLGWSLSP